jgi:hypothetical protein
MKKDIVLPLVLLSFFASSAVFGVSKTAQPNVIVIMTDDQGTIGAYYAYITRNKTY